MLSTIRQFQKSLLIIVTIVIIIAFAFLYSDYDFGKASFTKNQDACPYQVNGECYSLDDSLKLARSRGLAYNLGLYEFAGSLSGLGRMDGDPTDFVFNTIVLRDAAAELGVEPSDEEVKSAISSAPIFKIRPDLLNESDLRNTLAGLGLEETDLFYLMKDYLCYEKLRDLIGAGVKPVTKIAEQKYISRNQRFTTQLVDFKTKDFVDKVTISEEKIKEYYDARNDGPEAEQKEMAEVKDQVTADPAEVFDPEAGNQPPSAKAPKTAPPMLTFQERGFDFLKFTPTELPENATNEQKAKSKAHFETSVNDIYSQLTARGVIFMDVAKEIAAKEYAFKVELDKMEKFARIDAPESINSDFELLRKLFREGFSEGDISLPHKNQDGSFYIFQVNEYQAPREKTLEEARAEIVETLTQKEAKKLANEAASAALAKFSEGLAAGKSVQEIAGENQLELVSIPNFSQVERPEVDDAGPIINSVSGLTAGKISKVSERSSNQGYFLTFVEKIEIYEDENKADAIKALADAEVNFEKETLFQSWLKQRGSASNAKRPDSLSNLVRQRRG